MQPALAFSSPVNSEIWAASRPLKNPASNRIKEGNGGGTRRRMKGNRVLLIGKQRELALYRAAVLTDRGFDVRVPADVKEGVKEITRGTYDVAVLSYTLSSDEVEHMAELVRQSCPECPLVAISATGQADRRVNPDATVVADEGPAGLIRVLQRLRRNQ